MVVITQVSFTEKTAFVKKKKKEKKKDPYLPYVTFFGVVTLNTQIFLFGPNKHAKHFEKMAELTYAELTQGRESTRYLTRTNLRHWRM